MTDYDTRLSALALHSDPDRGSPYWIEFFRKSELSIEECAERPLLMPPMDVEELRRSPIERFIPSSVLASSEFLITGETSGFTGKPVATVFTEDEFDAAFVKPFINRAAEIGFPVRARWLWIGPTGPHIIGKAVRAILRSVGGVDPFSVDFDPRWYNRLPDNSMTRRRYLAHVLDQVSDVIERQNVEVVFTTPPMLAAMREVTTPEMRGRVKGVHYGGVATTRAEYARFADDYPNAVHMNGYGNSLFGMFPEISFGADGIEYSADSARVDLSLTEERDGETREVEVGGRGRVTLSRYDRSCLLVNMMERDAAIRTERGFLDPQPLQSEGRVKKVIY